MGPTRAQRRLVHGAVALLLVGGLVGIEAWPLTAWRLFSETRHATQPGWSLQAVDGDGATAPVPLAELGLGLRFVGRSLDDLSPQPTAAGVALCDALLDAVRDARPGTTGLEVVHTRRRLREVDGGGGALQVSATPFLRCGAPARPR